MTNINIINPPPAAQSKAHVTNPSNSPPHIIVKYGHQKRAYGREQLKDMDFEDVVERFLEDFRHDPFKHGYPQYIHASFCHQYKDGSDEGAIIDAHTWSILVDNIAILRIPHESLTSKVVKFTAEHMNICTNLHISERMMLYMTVFTMGILLLSLMVAQPPAHHYSYRYH